MHAQSKNFQESKIGNLFSSCHAYHLVTRRSFAILSYLVKPLSFDRSLSFWQLKAYLVLKFNKPINFLESYLFVSVFGFHARRVEFKKEDSTYQYQGPSRISECMIFSAQ